MKSIKTLILFTALCGVNSSKVFAGDGHSHGAHEHGVANLKIAVDKQTLKFIFQSPADTIYGFEHEAKSPKEKAAQKLAFDKLSLPAEFIELSPKSNCQLTTSKAPSVPKSRGHGHQDVHVEWSATCESSITGQTAQFRFGSIFPSMHRLKIEVLGDEKQTKIDLKNGNGQISF